ncbi:MAG TPA: ATP-binding protein [Kofleriaceae bacterium]|jgi:signal transduction histidine kinase|nr:ATP-binding protein [Kofleriaceae bacterium]
MTEEELARVFPGDSELARLMRAHAWAETPLGEAGAWPAHLKSALSLCLTSRFPIVIMWGPELALLYNDAYIPFLGETKHPRFLGRPAKECWDEAWATIGPMLASVRETGSATWSEDLPLYFARRLPSEEVYARFTYGPILAPDGVTVDGIFAPCTETTDQILGARRLDVLRRLGTVAEGRSVSSTIAEAVRVLASNPHDVPFSTVYLVDERGQTATIEASSISSDLYRLPRRVSSAEAVSSVWPIAQVMRARRAVLATELDALPVWLPGGPWPEPASHAVVLPIHGADHQQVAAVLVVGLSPRRVWDTGYRTFIDLVASHLGTALTMARAYEQERRRAESLAELDRAKTTFLSSISHEFRTPLTLLLGPMEDALAGEHALAGSDLEAAYRSGRRLLKLVNGLLDFSSIEGGRIRASYQPTDLATFTADLASVFRSATERAGLRLEVACPPLSRAVNVDRVMWEKIVCNLISNAFKFTFEGTIFIGLEEVGDQVTLTVRDTGIGIAAAHLPHVFERFYRIEDERSRTYEGSGIGLATVRELARLHDGNVGATSMPGAGSTFTVAIPFGEPRGASVDGPAKASSLASAFVDEALQWLPAQLRPAAHGITFDPRVRILIADDNADMRAYFTRLLGKRWLVEAVDDGEQALAAARARRPTLVITDSMMPNLDGLGLVRALRDDPSLRTIPIIMVSARAGDDDQIEGLEAGVDDYVIKPFSARELVARVTTRLELQRLGTRLEQERRAVSELFRQCPVPVAILRGHDLVIEEVNPAFEPLLGKPAPGRRLADALPDIERMFGAMLRDVLATGVAHVGRETHVPLRRKGELVDTYWTFICASLRGPSADEDCVVAICTDVTEQVLAGKRLEVLAAEAHAANRTKDEFLAMLGHELRNPLSPILTSLDVMRLRGDSMREHEVIERQVRHLTRLVDDLLDISRITRGKVALRKLDVELSAVLARAYETAAPWFEQREQRFLLDVPETGLVIHADPDRLAQVFANLLTNASKYSEHGTRVIVRGRRVGDRIRTSVIDQGIGIAPEMIDKVFDMFVQQPQTLERSRGGLGLGLSIVRNLVEAHGGTVAVRSEGLGKGSELTVELPAVHVRSELPSATPTGMRTDKPSARILVVDDNQDAAYAMKLALELLGYAVTTAHDGYAAIAAANEFNPDIALLDIGLPEMDGYELAQRLKQHGDLRLVAITGYGQASDVRRSEEAGFERHLVKPVDIERLERVVRELRAGA